ncbi:unnamed protein product [Musa hybrid cultivar]
MKLDASGLQYFPSVTGGGVDGLGEDLFAAPSFQLPDSFDMVKPAKGTTTLAFILKNGVIVAADSRAGMGGYIPSSTVVRHCSFGHRLLLPLPSSTAINPYMLGTMAGGAADCQFWHRNLGIKV